MQCMRDFIDLYIVYYFISKQRRFLKKGNRDCNKSKEIGSQLEIAM